MADFNELTDEWKRIILKDLEDNQWRDMPAQLSFWVEKAGNDARQPLRFWLASMGYPVPLDDDQAEHEKAVAAAISGQAGPDMVNHPPHYTSDPSGVECITVTRHRNFNIGNAIKYLWRAGLKTREGQDTKEKQIEDLRKAIFYITDEINRLENS